MIQVRRRATMVARAVLDTYRPTNRHRPIDRILRKSAR